MNEETVRNWIQKADNDLKIGKDDTMEETQEAMALAERLRKFVLSKLHEQGFVS